MARKKLAWGAPRIHGELQELGYHLSQSRVRRYILKREPTEKQPQNRRIFLENHRNVMAAMDFITVATATFRQLYALVR